MRSHKYNQEKNITFGNKEKKNATKWAVSGINTPLMFQLWERAKAVPFQQPGLLLSYKQETSQKMQELKQSWQ